MRARPWLCPVAALILGASAFIAMPRFVVTYDRIPSRTSVLLIITDDQRWDTLDVMLRARRQVADPGVTFTNAFVSNALCCPSRATILTGDLSHTTGVYRVTPPYGGFPAFRDADTLATRLDDEGYTTGLFGKYLDAYQGAAVSGYVPPGWDRWVAMVHSQYEDYQLTVDGTVVGSGPDDYATDVLGAAAEDFIRETSGPLLVVYAPPAPHDPATPSPGDVDTIEDLETWAPPSYDRPVANGPAHMASLTPIDGDAVQGLRRRQLETLSSVDRQISLLVTALRQTGRLHDTVIVFTSDNGLLWGEHRWTKKEVPYEEAIRVPLLIRFDPLTRRHGRATSDALVLNTDIAPTILDLVGVPAPPMDGMSLAPLLRAPDGSAHEAILLEHMEGANPVPTYCGVRTAEAKFVRYATGEEELFDLVTDPHEMTNVAATSPIRDDLAAQLDAMCRPRPPGWFDGRGGPAAAVVVALALGLAVAARRRYAAGLAGINR